MFQEMNIIPILIRHSKDFFKTIWMIYNIDILSTVISLIYHSKHGNIKFETRIFGEMLPDWR